MFRVFLLTFVLLLTGCTRQSQAPKKPVFVVNSNSLSAEAFGRDLAKRLKNFDALSARNAEVLARTKNQILQDFLIDSLLRDFAQKEGLLVSRPELEAESKSAQEQYPNVLTFRAALASQNLTQDEWKRNLESQLIRKKVFERLRKDIPPPTPEALRKYYETHKAEFQRPTQAKIQQILVAKQEEAETLEKEIKRGGDFGAIAKKYSSSPDAAQNGVVGWVDLGSVPVFDSAFKLRPGQVSSILKSSFGFHLIKLLDKRSPSVISYEKAAPLIKVRLMAEAENTLFKKWLDQALAGAKVMKDQALIDSLRVETQGALEQ